MAIADHAIAARAISVPEEGAVAQISVLGTVILADAPATLITLEDGPAAVCLAADLAASVATMADASAGSVILADARAGGVDPENLP